MIDSAVNSSPGKRVFAQGPTKGAAGETGVVKYTDVKPRSLLSMSASMRPASMQTHPNTDFPETENDDHQMIRALPSPFTSLELAWKKDVHPLKVHVQEAGHLLADEALADAGGANE